MSKTKQQKQHIAIAYTITIFSGTKVIVKVQCGNSDEINAVLAHYNAVLDHYSDPMFTYKLSQYEYIV